MSEKYEFITEEYAQNKVDNVVAAPTLQQMFSWLGVSKSGYYEWLNRPASPSERRRDLFKVKIKTLFDSFGGTYGYRRIHAELVRAGERVGAALVRRLMRELAWCRCSPGRIASPPCVGRVSRTLPTSSGATSPPTGPGSSWWVTSPISRPGRAGSIWLPSLIVSTKK